MASKPESGLVRAGLRRVAFGTGSVVRSSGLPYPAALLDVEAALDHMLSETGAARAARGVLIVLLLGFVIAGMLRPLVRPYAYSDFATFYSAAKSFAAGESPYDLEALQDSGQADFKGWIGRYLYPPPFAACAIRPLLLLPFEVARRLWVLCESLAYLVAGVLLAQVVFGKLRAITLAGIALLALPFTPFYLDLKLGSVSGLLLLLMVVFLHEHRQRHLNRAALALAAGILLKLSPALLAVYLLALREIRMVIRIGMATLLILLLSLPWTGLQTSVDYVTKVVPVLGTANFSWFTNQSVDAFFWRLFVSNPDTTPWIASFTLYRLLTWSTSGAILVGLGMLVLHHRRQRDSTGDADLWGFSITLVASLLLARVTWEYMLVLALPCYSLWLHDTLRGQVGTGTLVWIALSFALCALPIPYTAEPLRSGPGILLEAPRLYGLMLLFGLSLAYRLRWRRTG